MRAFVETYDRPAKGETSVDQEVHATADREVGATVWGPGGKLRSRSLFALRLGNQDAFVLLVVIHQRIQEERECFVLTLLQKPVTGPVKALGHLVGGRLLLVHQLGDNAGAS